MCGIFGASFGPNLKFNQDDLETFLQNGYKLSETRGKESAGIACRLDAEKVISVLKVNRPSSELIKTQAYQEFTTRVYKNKIQSSRSIALIAHCRLVTNGTAAKNINNQPVIKAGVVGVHNGIICNVADLWKKYEDSLKPQFEVDTEVFLELYKKAYQYHSGTGNALQEVFSEIEGTANVALLFDDRNEMLLATNNGSLYFAASQQHELLVFASEAFILQSLVQNSFLKNYKLDFFEQIHPNHFVRVDLEQFKFQTGPFASKESFKVKQEQAKYEIKDSSPPISETAAPNQILKKELFEFNLNEIMALKRCSRCVLPETFPFISFNEAGICNYCENHKMKPGTLGREKFKELAEKQKRKANLAGQDCIVAFSGGRDSCYGLHLLREEFGLTPVTFTYDWGLITDLARRNISRMCAKLGIENILVSADIPLKRHYVKQNLLAWLKRPNLGIIPLLMAGDKEFFRVVNQVKKQTGIDFDIWMGNSYENTDFKVGFCGIAPDFEKKRTDSLGWLSKFTLPAFYLKNFLLNPSYLNSSIFDTIKAYQSYYFEPRDNFHLLFDYVPWSEKTINQVLIDQYNFELSPDTNSTWRIGDGTAAFYNYIYYTIAGFTEIDTFRSNQIRDGVLNRNEAIELIKEENQPRFESIKWYLDTIGVDMAAAIETINNQPKLYRHLNNS